MDVVEVASKTEMLGYGDELQQHVDALNVAGYDLFLARRKAVMRPKSGSVDHAKGLNVEILYLVTAPAGASPGRVAVLKETEFGWG